MLLIFPFSPKNPGTQTKTGRMKKGKSDKSRKPQSFLICSRQSERGLCYHAMLLTSPSQINTSYNLYPHPNTNHRLNPKLQSAKHDNLASPPTTPAMPLPQSRTTTDNYHLCHIQHTVINQESGNYCVCFCVHSHKNVHGSAYAGMCSFKKLKGLK